MAAADIFGQGGPLAFAQGLQGNAVTWAQSLAQRALEYAQSLGARGAFRNAPAAPPNGAPQINAGGPSGPAAAQVGAPNVPNQSFDAGAAGLGGLGGGAQAPAAGMFGGGFSMPHTGGQPVPAARPAAPTPHAQFAASIQNRAQSRVNRAFTPGPNRRG